MQIPVLIPSAFYQEWRFIGWAWIPLGYISLLKSNKLLTGDKSGKAQAMKNAFKVVAIVIAALFVMPFKQAIAEDKAGIEIGILKCSVIEGSRVTLLVRSTADVVCTFNNQGTIEKYLGETGIALGLDLSFKRNEKIAFGLIAASHDVQPGSYALAGKYIGGQAAVELGAGLGAKVLLGAGKNSFGLQPLALETSAGVGASAGIGFLYIEKAD